jgi:hypothetical protein
MLGHLEIVERSVTQNFGLVLAACIIGNVLSTDIAWAQTNLEKKEPATPGVAYDCTDIKLNHEYDAALTREENLELMDRALFQSLSKFDACQDNQANSSGGGGGGNDGGSEGKGNSPGESGSSVASSDMSGNESPKSDATADGQGSWAPLPQQNASTEGSNPTNSETPSVATPPAFNNGQIPNDIPPANNDTVLEAQIRRAAINEPDPILKKKLWNEYRKYKGLPASL